MNKVIFIGGVGVGMVPTNGVTAKNHFLLSKLQNRFRYVTVIDTDRWKYKPYILLHLLGVILFNPNTNYIISTNNKSSYKFLQILGLFPGNRKIYYWVIGGSIANWIKDKRVKSEPYRRLKFFIVEGSDMKLTLGECGFDNVIHIPNFKDITYLPIKKQSTDKRLHFVFLSRIMPEKGCDEIMQATRILLNEGLGDSFIVDFFGKIDNAYAKSFMSQVETISNVSYNGFLDLRDTKNYDILSRYDIMLFPTYWHGEGFPGILIDAFIAGLPVIATDWSQNKDILKEGETGILIPVHDVEALAEAMKKMIMNRDDLMLMSDKCQQLAKTYDTDEVLSEDLFTQLGLYES